MRSILLAFIASFTAELVNAIPSGQPAPTQVLEIEYDPYGWSPNPTQAPNLELMKRAGALDKRQTVSLSSGQLVGYFAPDSMCGYISGSIGASLPCSASSRCAAVAPIANSPGAVGCCPVGSSGCYFITTCYNSADIAASKCDHGCQQDVDVRLCSAASSPYCYGYTWPDISVTIWGCASTSASTKDTVLFTYLGETDKRSWSAYYYTPSGSGSNSNSELLTAVTKSANTSSTSSESSSSSSTGGGGGGGGGGSHAGAIAGGVVGGIAVLGAVVLGIFFLLTRRRKHQNAATQPGQASTGPAPGHSPQPMSAVSGGASSAAAGDYYGHQHKPTVSEMSSPLGSHVSPTSAYAPYKDSNNPYNHRVSHFSEAGSPVPPYGHPGQMQQAPMELDATSSAAHYNSQGQPVYEAPADVPAPHHSPTGATHPPVS